MDIREDSESFEAWLRTKCKVKRKALECKHEQMKDTYPFFRATYYRWSRHWRTVCADLLDAPPVLAIGDIHLENYGTWRDADCRLCWGVNDFDEADHLPYTHDLVRLAASTLFAEELGARRSNFGGICSIIQNGYQMCLQAGGEPFVLEEIHAHLRKLALRSDQKPPKFWRKLSKLPVGKRFTMNDAAADALNKALLRLSDESEFETEFRPRMFAGVGSLGKARYIALVKWNGGWICREAKAITPPATAWLNGTDEPSRLTDVIRVALRSPDPFYEPIDGWITRRLAPHCSRIELDHLKAAKLSLMLDAMGREIANVHLGTAGAKDVILNDLSRRPRNWLENAAMAMANAIERDAKQWRKNPLP